MDNETADIAVLITKEPTDHNFVTEVIIDGKVVAAGMYATKQAALRFATFETIRLTKQNNEGRNNA